MTIVSKVTRFFLLLGAVSIGATGFKYIQGSRNGTLATGPLGAIFEPEIFKGYGLEALTQNCVAPGAAARRPPLRQRLVRPHRPHRLPRPRAVRRATPASLTVFLMGFLPCDSATVYRVRARALTHFRW